MSGKAQAQNRQVSGQNRRILLRSKGRPAKHTRPALALERNVQILFLSDFFQISFECSTALQKTLKHEAAEFDAHNL
jgi:hypothetical protein